MESSAVQPEITPVVKKKILVKKKAVIAPAPAPSGSKQITAIFGDCREKLAEVADKSIQTVCIDPPYNIGKDTWDSIDDYIPWLTGIIQQLETKMKDNGALFVFHNDMEQIAELMVSIKKNTKLQFKQMIVWNKRRTAYSIRSFV